MIGRCAFFLVALVAGLNAAGEPGRLDWMERVYGDGRHNAFTDLVSWNGHYYLCFRHAASHMSLDGEIRVMRSADMKSWEPCGTIDTAGDDRDPHLTVAGGRLYAYFGTWDIVHRPGTQLPDRGCVRSYCAYTTDGAAWSKPEGTYEPGWWLWRVSWRDGVFYSAAYTALRPTPELRETRLLSSSDGVTWTLVSTVTKERMAGEADIQFEADGAIWLISRTGKGGAMFSRSDAARANWTASDLGVVVHSPAIARWKGRVFVAGRGREGEASVMRVWELLGDVSGGRVELRQVITLPSGGDTAYPGLLADPASLGGDEPAFFVTWYSQHERESVAGGDKNTACIYAGRFSVGVE